MLFDHLCLDIKNEIIHKLPRRELYYLSLTSTNYNKLINFNQLVINTIQDRLKKEFGNHYDNIVKLMNDNGAFISGSFILQCILDEYWTSLTDIYMDSDINLVCPHYGNNIGKLYNQPIYGKNHDVTDLEYYLYNHMHYLELIHDYKGIPMTKHHPILYHIIHESYYGSETDTNSKVIKINALTVEKNIHQYHEFINNRVDFDICKNIYHDGKLYIKDIDNILNKKITFKCHTRLDQSLMRYHKYKTRGFVFNDFIYDDVKEADYCEQRVFATDLNNVPSSITNFIKVELKENHHLIIKNCITHECIIYFCDQNIKHEHYVDRPHYPTQHHIYLK